MPGSLINSDNRLLSWSIGDFGLYGAAVTPIVAPATAAMPAATAAGDEASDDAVRPAESVETGSRTDFETVSSDMAGPIGAGSSTAPTAIFANTAAAPTTDVPPGPLAPQAPADMGSGSVAYAAAGQIASAPPSGAAPAVDPGPSATPLAPSDFSTALAAPIVASLADTATIVSSTPGVITDLITAASLDGAAAASPSDTVIVPTVVDTLSTATGEAAAAATDSLASATGLATAAVADTVAAVADASTTVVAVASATVDALPAIDPLETIAAVAPVVAAVGTTVDALTAADPVAAVAPIATGSSAAANDLLTDFAGTNPAGGVATLVDMVVAADQLDLSHVNAPDLADTGSIVDLLAFDMGDAPQTDLHDLSDSDDGDHGLLGL